MLIYIVVIIFVAECRLAVDPIDDSTGDLDWNRQFDLRHTYWMSRASDQGSYIRGLREPLPPQLLLSYVRQAYSVQFLEQD